MPVDLTKFARLDDASQMVGKTVKAASLDNGLVAISFDDGSYFYAISQGDPDSGYELDHPYTLNATIAYRDLELITHEECLELDAADKARRAAERTERERQDFLALKAKFEPTP